jgi:CheY-like chemotaxis protein
VNKLSVKWSEANMTSGVLGGMVVLVVDDNADSRSVLRQLLEMHGARVWSANGGREALVILERADPHVLVSDIDMPNLDGLDLVTCIRAREIAAHVKHLLPAVAVTAFCSDYDRRKCIQAGFQCHIPKPVDSIALIQAVALLGKNAKAADALSA